VNASIAVSCSGFWNVDPLPLRVSFSSCALHETSARIKSQVIFMAAP
jgi:hypothetical protein